MSERYSPEYTDIEDFFYDDFGHDFSLGSPKPNKNQEVDMTKTPTTPREAAAQSAYFVDELKEKEAGLKYEARDLASKRYIAVAGDKLIDAESKFKYAEKIQDNLRDIKQQDNPEVQRQIWEDLLSIITAVGMPFQYNIVDNLYQRRIGNLAETIVQARYGTVDGALEPLILRNKLEEIMKVGAARSVREAFDSKQTYEASLVRPGAWSSSSPMNADVLSEESWAEIDEVVARVKELRNHLAGDTVSPELSAFLSASIDDLLEIANEEVLYAKQELQEQAAAATMSDDDMRARARAIVDEGQALVVQQAREHAQKNLGLLRKAALAEAALDGVRIKRR